MQYFLMINSASAQNSLAVLLGLVRKFQFSLLFQKYIAAEEALNDFFRDVPFAKEACIQKLVDIQFQSFFQDVYHHPLMDAYTVPLFVHCDTEVIIYFLF